MAQLSKYVIYEIHLSRSPKYDGPRIQGSDTMAEELLTLEANHTWDLVPHPSSSSYIESKSVCSVKVKSVLHLIDTMLSWLHKVSNKKMG